MKTLLWAVSALMTLSLASAAWGIEPPAVATYDLERVIVAGEDVAKAKVGDKIELKIAGYGASSLNLKAIKLSPPQGTELDDLGWELLPSPKDGASLFIVPLKPGKLTLPSLDMAEETLVGRTNPWVVEVESAISADDPTPEELAALKPPLGLKFPWWVIVAMVLVLALLIAAAIYAFRKWRRKRAKKADVQPQEPPRPEDIVALDALDALEKSGALRRGEFKKHYFGISEILKAYIGGRYRFDASESTTREMITTLEEKRLLSDRELDGLDILFEKLDLVKFTDHVPLLDEGMNLLESAREFVRTTKRPPPVPVLPTAGGIAK